MRSASYPLVAMLAALAGFAALQAAAALIAGTFEYPLDDVYIHLSMAENIARGTYGVNAGEPASAASSILYPLLLLPFPGTEAQRLLPFLWNVVAVAGCGWVWGRIVAAGGLAGAPAVFFLVAGPVLLNMSGVGFTGMEAGLHILVSLMIVLGLWRFLDSGRVAPWLIAAAVAAPILRYEGLALALAAACVLALRGRPVLGAATAAGALGCVVGFSLFLVSIGLDPLPGSVMAKLAGSEAGGSVAILQRVAINLAKPAGLILGVLVAVFVVLRVTLPELGRGAAGWLTGAVWLSAAAHLAVGQIGWMHRYEPYILACLVAALLLGTSALRPAPAAAVRGLAVLAIAAAGAVYLPDLWRMYVWNPRAIHLQQTQMARIARDVLDVPVAVNDLGRVAWRNPNYVLDIFGLGSAETRKVRFGPATPAPGWAGPIAEKHGVRAAMLYDSWFAAAVGPDWQRIGDLTMASPRGVLGDWTVSLYATDPSFAEEMRARLAAFAPDLPSDAILTLEDAALAEAAP